MLSWLSPPQQRTVIRGFPQMIPRKSKRARPLRLVADPLIEQAERLVARVRTELPTHDGLARAASGVAAAAIQAERVSRSMNRLFSIHRLPVFFLAGALLCLGLWIYWQFFHV
jgi:hypothetical protein